MRRVIVAGGRDFGNRRLTNGQADIKWMHQCYQQMGAALSTLYTDWDDTPPKIPGFGIKDIEVLSGMASGADTLAIDWCVVNWVPWKEYPADWDTHGKKAGPLRNIQMAENADVLVAFWDGKSRGTKHMIDTAFKYGLEVHIYRYTNE